MNDTTYDGSMPPAACSPRQPLHPHAWLALAALGAALLAISSCAPATGTEPPVDRSAAGSDRTIVLPAELAEPDPLLRTAWEAWLRMELHWLRDGRYSTDALLELMLPSGVRWTVIEYGPAGYTLAVTGDASPRTLRVDPAGVNVQH